MKQTEAEGIVTSLGDTAHALPMINSSIGLKAFIDGISGLVAGVPAAWVRCEIINIHRTPKFVAFELSEQQSGVQVARVRGGCRPADCVAFDQAFAQAGIELASGLKVLLHLRPRLTSGYGFQVDILDIDPAYSVGDAKALADAIRSKLIAAGLWDRNRLLTQPTDYESVAVISPSGAAGAEDFKVTVAPLERLGLTRFTYFESPFQGRGAPGLLAQRLRELQVRCRAGEFDCVVMTRGGGAASDFSWLADHTLVAAVCGMSRPMLIGIGHERDRTLLDEVATISCGTPSKVADHVRRTVISAAMNAADSLGSIRTQAMADLGALQIGVAVTQKESFGAARASLVWWGADVAAIWARVKSATSATVAIGSPKVAGMLSAVIANGRAVVLEAEGASRAANHAVPVFAIARLGAAEADVGAALQVLREAPPMLLEDVSLRVTGTVAALSAQSVGLVRLLDQVVAAATGTIIAAATADFSWLIKDLSSLFRVITAAPACMLDAGAAAEALFARIMADASATLAHADAGNRSFGADCMRHAGYAADAADQSVNAASTLVMIEAARVLATVAAEVKGIAAVVDVVDPVNVLAAGYAVLRDESGTPLTRIHRVQRAGRITAELKDGLVELRLTTGEA